jgi:hypothetical protein
MGVNPSTPPDSIIQSRVPATGDSNFIIGTLWLVPQPESIWMLVDLSNNSATWVELYPGGGSGATDFITNSGTAVEVGGELNVFGANVIETSGAGNTVTITTTNGTDGQVIIGGGTDPVWANITSNGGTITITETPNAIDLATTMVAADEFVTDDGTAFPSGGVLQIKGENVVTTSGSSHTITVGLTEALDGQIPIAATGGPTAYANITSNDGSVTINNGANTIDLSATGVTPASAVNFFYYQASDSASLTMGSTYYLGAIVALTKLFDAGNNVSPGDGSGTAAVFTAPVAGVYLVGGALQSSTSGSPASYFMEIETTDSLFTMYVGDSSLNEIDQQVLVLLKAGDTVMWPFDWNFGGTSKPIGGGTSPYITYIYGYLVSPT